LVSNSTTTEIMTPASVAFDALQSQALTEFDTVGGWNITTTRRDRQRGHISRPSKLDSGKFGPRVLTNVSRSSSRVYWHSRRVFMPSRFPHAQRAVMRQPAANASPRVSTTRRT
jgi:hypothetical protein